MKFDYDLSLTRQDALSALKKNWNFVPQKEEVALEEAFGRILAEDVYAIHSLPVVRSSCFDGIGVRSSDFSEGMPDTSSWLRDRDFCQADTGDDFADAFDAVIAIEAVEFGDMGGVKILKKASEIEKGAGVKPRGALVEEGSLIAHKNTQISPELLAALAIGGAKKVSVVKKPVVSFIPTGSELVPYETSPQRGQHIEANSLMAKGMLSQWGAEAQCFPIVKDDEELISETLQKALESSDIVLINGGSSRGEEDFTSYLMQEQATYFSHGVRAVPGRPIGMALIEGKPVINIPGPTLACYLAFDWLVQGLVAHYFGREIPRNPYIDAVLEEDIKKPEAFERISRVSLEHKENGSYTCKPLPASFGIPQNIYHTDGFLVLPIGDRGAQKGDVVKVTPVQLPTRFRGNC